MESSELSWLVIGRCVRILAEVSSKVAWYVTGVRNPSFSSVNSSWLMYRKFEIPTLRKSFDRVLDIKTILACSLCVFFVVNIKT